MPLYDYKCAQCGKVSEVRHGFNDSYAEPCPACGGTLARVFNPATIVFKGSGFYVTDSRKGRTSDSPAPADASPAGKPAAAKTETPKSEPAPAASDAKPAKSKASEPAA
jgi:putative FmdB family regulatory protein